MSTLPVGPVRSVSPDCFRAARGRFRSLLLGGFVSAVSMSLATILPHTALGQNQEESKTQSKRTLIVLNDESGSTEKILEQLREKLQGLPQAQRDEILESVEKSLNQAMRASGQAQRVIVKAVDADGKDLSTEGNVVTMTIVQESLPSGSKDANSRDAEDKDQSDDPRLKELKQVLPKAMGKSMIIRGVTKAENLGGPRFRIGLSVVSPDVETSGNSDGKSALGLIVERIMEDSPASEAGIEQGDVILMINGNEAKDLASLQQAVQQAGKEDRSVKLKLERDGKELTIKVKPTASEDDQTMSFDLVPPIGSVLPLDLPGGGMMEGRVVEGLRMLSPMEFGGQISEQTSKEIAELKEEIQELKQMVKKLLEKVEDR